jgi:iron complex transport system substrate-binding protein
VKAALRFAASVCIALTWVCCALPAAGSAATWSVVDDAGIRLELPLPARRIVSLAPGATAMLFAAGAGALVVGTANYSDDPAAARAIPRVGDSQGFDLERILALRPDVIVVWGGGTNRASIELLERRGLRIYHHQVAVLADLPDAIRRLGQLAGTVAVAEPNARQLAARIAALRAHAVPAQPSVLLQIWDKPVYTVGGRQLLSDVLGYCGFRNVFGDLADAGPAVSVESVIARDPAVIVAVAPSVAAGQAWLAAWRTFPALQAVREQRLLVSVDQRFSRLGPAVVDAAEQLCGQLRAAVPRQF